MSPLRGPKALRHTVPLPCALNAQNMAARNATGRHMTHTRDNFKAFYRITRFFAAVLCH